MKMNSEMVANAEALLAHVLDVVGAKIELYFGR